MKKKNDSCALSLKIFTLLVTGLFAGPCFAGAVPLPRAKLYGVNEPIENLLQINDKIVLMDPNGIRLPFDKETQTASVKIGKAPHQCEITVLKSFASQFNSQRPVTLLADSAWAITSQPRNIGDEIVFDVEAWPKGVSSFRYSCRKPISLLSMAAIGIKVTVSQEDLARRAHGGSGTSTATTGSGVD